MNRFELILSIIKFFRENKELKKSDLGFKEPLLLSSDNDNTKFYIVRYYEYDVTIFVYKYLEIDGVQTKKLLTKYQEYYADLSDDVLEKIHDQIDKYSFKLKSKIELN